MTNKISRNAYSMTMTAAVIGMGMMASHATAQEATPPVQEPVAVATQAEAQPPAPAPGSFEALDANADGNLSSDEIPADHALSKKFKKADADKNGSLNKQEFDAFELKNTK